MHDEGFGRALVLEDDGVLHPKANLSLLKIRLARIRLAPRLARMKDPVSPRR